MMVSAITGILMKAVQKINEKSNAYLAQVIKEYIENMYRFLPLLCYEEHDVSSFITMLWDGGFNRDVELACDIMRYAANNNLPIRLNQLAEYLTNHTEEGKQFCEFVMTELLWHPYFTDKDPCEIMWKLAHLFFREEASEEYKELEKDLEEMFWNTTVSEEFIYNENKNANAESIPFFERLIAFGKVDGWYDSDIDFDLAAKVYVHLHETGCAETPPALDIEWVKKEFGVS
jgi:hypothetical protein